MTTFNACTGMDATTKASPSEDDNKLLKIKKLKAKLINEEHRLVLMKKIRQSQTRPINQQQQQQQQVASAHQMNSSPSSVASGSNHSSNPVKKLRPSGSSSIGGTNNPLTLQKNQTPSYNSPQLASMQINPAPAHAHQRPKNNNLWNPPPQQVRQPTPAGLAPPHVGNLSRQPITTPPHVVVNQMMGNLNAGQQSLLMNQINAVTAAAAAATDSNRRSLVGNMTRQPISTPPNIVQDVRSGLPGQQQSMSSRRSHVGNSSRQPITTAPNVVQDIRGALASQQSLLMNANNLATPPSSGRNRSQQHLQQAVVTPQQQQQQSPFNKSQAAQILLQKRTEAKTAIQKNLEQTLMQLPQKNIQLGIDFVPNANNIEFIYYVGLEACVDYLTNTKNPHDVEPLKKPFECSTCGTDFTPSWSWKRSNAVCENCVGNHVKKSIRNSQANRIKSVLTKAAKQEHEMDQKIMAEAAKVVSSPSTPTTSTNQRHSLLQPASHTQRSTPHTTPNWSNTRVNSSPLAAVNRSSSSSTTTTTSPANVQPTINLNNPLAALQPAALASLLQMNPQFGSLASLMTANAAPNNTQNSNTTNQFAQVAAILMNQLTTMNLWNKR